MNIINFIYFNSTLEESIFENRCNGEACFFCKGCDRTIVGLEESLEIITNKIKEQPEYMCLKCLKEKRCAFV